MPRLDEIRLDIVVLSWTTLFSCACAFLFGLVPAIKASGISGQELVVRSGRGSTRSASALRQALMLAEIAVAMVLLSGAGLMVHTMLRLARVDPGFDPHNLQTVMFSLTGPAVARRQETGVLRRRRRPPSCGAWCGERRGHLFAADSRLELVEGVQFSRQDPGALDIGRRVSECGHGPRDRRLFRNAQDPADQRPVFQPVGHARFAARCHCQQQRRQEVLAE